MVKKITSNGLSGASQAGLSSAFLNDIEIDGYAPKNYEINGVIYDNLKYLGVKESLEFDLSSLIEDSIIQSDGVLFFTNKKFNYSLIEEEILYIMERSNKPYKEIDISNPIDIRIIEKFIMKYNIETLHITGREDIKGENRIYLFVVNYLNKMLKDMKYENQFV